MVSKERKILLIEPPFYRLHNIDASLNKFPLSLGYLSGIIRLKKPEWKVKIYNSDFSSHDVSLSYGYIAKQGFDNYLRALHEDDSLIWKEIETKIRIVSPSVVGITVKSQNYASACIIAKIVKVINKDILVIFGGPHPSLIKGELLNNLQVDIGVLGEGEETIIEILECFENRRPFYSVRGIVCRKGNDIVENPLREPITDLDSLPFPITCAQECLIDFDKYPLQAFKYIFALRGCPFDCTFCGSRYIWGRKVRFRSVSNIIAEMQEIQKKGVCYVHFDDDTWGVKGEFIKDLCSAISKERLRLNWSCEIHVKLISNEIVELMKSAGCRSIMIGVESGSNEMLKLIRKNITIEEAFIAAEIIKTHKIYLQTFFMVGFPQETIETLNDTISAITSIPTDSVIYSVFTPYFGTEIFNYCTQRGIIPYDFDVSLYNHNSPRNYFCPNIPEDIFKEKIRELERKLDKLNKLKKLKMYFSMEGLLKLKQKGIKQTLSRLIYSCKK